MLFSNVLLSFSTWLCLNLDLIQAFHPYSQVLPMKYNKGLECSINEHELNIHKSSLVTMNALNRRRALERIKQIFQVTTAATGFPILTHASEEEIPFFNVEEKKAKKSILKGVVTLQPGTQIETTGVPQPFTESPKIPALYVTARPNKPDNVPKAILDGSRGKPPPVLIARFPLTLNDPEQQFPFHFSFSEADLTVEGQSQWFVSTKEDLIVSARLDLDGVAATRDPGDLVGRGVALGATLKSDDEVIVQLQGRGIGGKFVTKKTK